jgi:hypothetical protein
LNLFSKSPSVSAGGLFAFQVGEVQALKRVA